MCKPKCMMAAGEHLNAGRYASKPCFALNEHGCCEILRSLPARVPCPLYKPQQEASHGQPED